MGIECNDTADKIAKSACDKEHIDIVCPTSVRQIRSIIKSRQDKVGSFRRAEMYDSSPTLQHYIHVSQHTDVTYGRGGDETKARL